MVKNIHKKNSFGFVWSSERVRANFCAWNYGKKLNKRIYKLRQRGFLQGKPTVDYAVSFTYPTAEAGESNFSNHETRLETLPYLAFSEIVQTSFWKELQSAVAWTSNLSFCLITFPMSTNVPNVLNIFEYTHCWRWHQVVLVKYNADARVCFKIRKYRNLLSFLSLEPYWQSIGLTWKQ